MGPHLFERCRFPGLKKEYNAIVNQPQPPKPKDLGDPPEAPDSLFSPAAEPFRDDLKAYKAKVKTYRQEMDRWQDQFIYWKENRGKALASGEALISRVRKTQGGSFAVDVPGHWAKLGLLQIGMLSLLLLVQKRKDVL
jgi:hypothetical protein